MTDNTQPEAREFTMSQYASKDDMIGAMRKRIAELESELEAVGAGGVQALSAAPNGWESVIDEARSGLQDSEPSAFDNSGYRAFAETVLAAVEEGLSALAASPTPQALSAAPAGWKLVPVEPTDEMLKAADDGDDEYTLRNFGPGVQRVMQGPYDHYCAMLAASPTPPAEQQATKETSGGFHVWRDISTAPKDGSRFVATGHNYGLYSEVRHTCVAQWFRGCWMEASDWNETSELKYLTHWMPLPSPPDDVAAPAEQPATTEAATPKGAATTEAATPKGAATTGAPLGGVYAELPAPNLPRGGFPDLFTEGQMRDFADRTHALRLEQAATKAAPGEPCQDSTPHLSVGDSSFEGWYESYCPAHKADKQRARDAYAAGMGDPLVRAAPQREAQEPTTIDQKTMELAESVGLIGPASRIGDLHAAIQRFHDLICVNATIKAAVMAADVISGVATPARDYPPLPMQFACSGVFPVYSADQMRAYVDADRAAYAPGSSQPAPAPLSDDAKDVVQDAAFEAVRKKLCALPRFSFLSDGYGVRRVPDKSGSWIAFDAAHALFDPVAVDAARKQGVNHD